MLNKQLSLQHTVCLVLALGLAACQSAAASAPTNAPGGASTPVVNGTPAVKSTAAPKATAAPANATGAPAPTGMPPQSNAAAITPAERRAELEKLTNLLTFKVVGLDNAPLGTISDFIVNTCETYLVYMVLAPDPALQVAAGKQLIVPVEAVTINSGTLDAA